MRLNIEKLEQIRKEIGYKSMPKFAEACWIPYNTYKDYVYRWNQPPKENLNKMVNAINNRIKEKIKTKTKELTWLKQVTINNLLK